MAWVIGVSKGSGGGHPKHKVESDRWKNACRRPLVPESISTNLGLGVWLIVGTVVLISSSFSSLSFSS